MADAIELLTKRRSVPAINLVEPAPDAATVEAMLAIATRVPDHGKLAPWRFIRFAGTARAKAGALLAELASTRDGVTDPDMLDQERGRFTRAPLVIGVISRAAPHPKIPEWEQVLSAGAVCMNLLLAAHAHGFAAQWLTEWYAFDADAAARLGLGDGERFAGFIHIGTPNEAPTERPRPAVADLLTDWSDG